ncbi:MAG: hypothetical protein ACRDZR_09420, partial [Acidimicrobiales bacterium]
MPRRVSAIVVAVALVPALGVLTSVVATNAPAAGASTAPRSSPGPTSVAPYSLDPDTGISVHHSSKAESPMLAPNGESLAYPAYGTYPTTPAHCGTTGEFDAWTGSQPNNVAVYNDSCYSKAQVQTVVRLADWGLTNTNPDALIGSAGGGMHSGDYVIVTDWMVYWLNVTGEGGAIEGEWPLKPNDGSGNPNFLYLYPGNAYNWGPNWLLPGSLATGAPNTKAGMNLHVIATGGSDGNQTDGKGTFIFQTGTNRFIQPTTYVTPNHKLRTYAGPYQQLFQVAGTLTQEFARTHGNTTIVDSQGDRATLSFVVTYGFYVSTDPALAYTSSSTPNIRQAELVTMTTSITPHMISGSAIKVQTYNIGFTLQYETGLEWNNEPQTTPATQLFLESTTNFHTLHFFAGTKIPSTCVHPTTFGPSVAGHLCSEFGGSMGTGTVGKTNFLQEDNPSGSGTKTLSSGDADTFTTNDGRVLSVFDAPGSQSQRRDVLVWDGREGVINAETQFNSTIDQAQSWPGGTPVTEVMEMGAVSAKDATGTPVATNVTSASVSLSWGGVNGAASYHVERTGHTIGTTTGTSYTDATVAPGTFYTYTVTPYDSGTPSNGGPSAGTPSPSVSVTTLSPAPAVALNPDTAYAPTVFFEGPNDTMVNDALDASTQSWNSTTIPGSARSAPAVALNPDTAYAPEVFFRGQNDTMVEDWLDASTQSW